MIKGFFVTEFFFSLLKLSLSAQTLDGIIFMPEKSPISITIIIIIIQ